NDGRPSVGTNTAQTPVVVTFRDGTSQFTSQSTLAGSPPSAKLLIPFVRRDVRVVEGARLESVCRGNSTVGSNPTLSASLRSRELTPKRELRLGKPARRLSRP